MLLMSDFKTWFEQKYIEWFAKQKKRGSVREFSELLGADQRLVSNWMNGHKKPGPEYADKIAIFLDYDMTVYDLLDMPHPPKALLKLKAKWSRLSEDQRQRIDNVLDEDEPAHVLEPAKKPRTTH